jgi:hypothetical protein
MDLPNATAPSGGGEARALPQPVYDGFTEGFDIPGLKNAKALLDELTGPAAAGGPRPTVTPPPAPHASGGSSDAL